MRRLTYRVTSARLLVFGFVLQVIAIPPAFPATIKIPDSTPVKLFLLDKVSPANNELDDIIHFAVAEDVKVGGVVAIPQGCVATGHLVEVQHRRLMGRGGKLELTVDAVKAPDGTSIRLRAASVRRPKGKRSAKLSPVSYLAPRSGADLPQGTRVVAFVDGDREVSLPNAAPMSAAAPVSTPSATAPPVAPAPATEFSSVVFTSTPDHADITVDGKFLGTTPSTIRLASGDHSVTIEKSGFKAWQRILTVTSSGNITLDVTLEKIP